MPLIAATTSNWSGSLNPIDVGIMGVYLLAMVAIGVWAGRGPQSTQQYFLGDRSIPWWAVLLSIVATETSTVTFLSVPGKSYATGGDMRFLQITFGYIAGRLMVIWLLLPLYFRGEPFTAYEVLQRRFGKLSRRATSLLFLVTRNLSDALRLYLSALVLHTAMGLGLQSCIVIMGVVTIFYTYIGGVKSVVWNDCVQFVIYIAGAVLALYGIIHALPGGFDQFMEFGESTDRFRVFDFDWSLVKPSMTFWAGLIGGAFLTAATHGTDQLTVQRLLSARSQRGAAAALATSGFVILLQFTLFLIIGVALAAYYSINGAGVAAEDITRDRVFAHFIVHHLPVGLVGLTLAAVFAAAMSTLSGSFNSSATALVNDIIVPLRPMSPEAQLRLGKLATGGFGMLQVAIALVSYRLGASESIVESVLTIAAFASGPMLGLYLLAVLTRVREIPALCGFLGGLAFLTYLRLAHPDVTFPWYAAFGSAATMLVGLLASLIDEGAAADAPTH